MSSHCTRTWPGDRPTLPPIRDLFRDELSRSPRSCHPTESPPFALAKLCVHDDDGGRSHNSRSLLLHAPLVGPGLQSSSSRRLLTPTSSPPTYPHPLPRGAMSDIPHLPPLLGHFKSKSFPDSLNQRDMPSNANNYAGPYRCNSYDSRDSHHYPPDVAGFPRTDNRYDSSTSRYSHDRYLSSARLPSGAEAMMSGVGCSDTRCHPQDDQRAPTGCTPETPGCAVSTRGGFDSPNFSSISKYDCNYCGKGFNRPSSLKIHLNSHTGEKPFVCPVESCGRSFSVLSNMRRHARVHAQRSLKEQDSSDDGSDNAVPTSKHHHGRQDSTASSSSSRHSASLDHDSRPEKRIRHHSK